MFRRVTIRSEPSLQMVNYSNIKKVELTWSHIAITIEGNWDLEKQENIERCSVKSKEVEERGRREV